MIMDVLISIPKSSYDLVYRQFPRKNSAKRFIPSLDRERGSRR